MLPMELDKLVEDATNGDILDRISSLPDELLGHMLSFLPTICAVSTSILSTRWRYLFTLTHSLSFDDAPCFDGSMFDNEIETARGKSFKKFVYKVLEMHQLPSINKFSLLCRGSYDESDLDAWVNKAVQKGVQDLHFQVDVQKDYELPDELFRCETLARLKMMSYHPYGYEELKIPLSAWLPSLKVLHLENVKFVNYDAVERLFSGCELLEELTLKKCKCDIGTHIVVSTVLLKILTIVNVSFREGLFEIDAPNLTHLTYRYNTGVKIVPSWKYSCYLAKAELNFDYEDESAFISDSFPYDCMVIKAASYTVSELHLSNSSLKLLLKPDDHNVMPDFHSLSRLHLYYCPFHSWKYVMNLLDKLPQLETLVFEWDINGGSYCDPQPPPPKEALIPFSCPVKVIEMREFRVTEYSLLYLEHLLRNARVLERLILHKHTLQLGDELQINTDLLTLLRLLPRASKECFIELK